MPTPTQPPPPTLTSTLAALTTLESTFRSRTPQTDLPTLLTSALHHARTAIALSLASHAPSHWKRTAQLAVWHHRAFELDVFPAADGTVDLTHLDAAISSLRETVALLSSPETNADDVGGLQLRFQQGQLSNCLHSRFLETGERADLDAVIVVVEDILAGIPPDDEYDERVDALARLATNLNRRYNAFGEAEDLDRAVAALEEAAVLPGLTDRSKAEVVSRLGSMLFERFSLAGSRDDLRRVGEMMELGLELKGGVDGDALVKLAGYLLRIVVGKSYADEGERAGSLNRCIQLMTRALEVDVPEGEEGVLLRLQQFRVFGDTLVERYKLGGELEDLDGGVVMFKKALVLDVAAREGMAIAQRITKAMVMRFSSSSSLDDLNEAFRTAMGMFDDSKVVTYDLDDLLGLIEVAKSIESGLKRHDNFPAYADEVIKTAYMAIERTPKESVDDCLSLLEHVHRLYDLRFKKTQSLTDLDSLIRVSAEVLDKTPVANIEKKQKARLRLVSGLVDRFHRNGSVSMEDISRSISEMDDVLTQMPADDPDRGMHLEALSGYLADRFYRSAYFRTSTFDVNWLADLDRSISLLSEALDLIPAGTEHDNGRATTLRALGNAHRKRGEYRFDTGIEGHEDDLAKAIELILSAIKLGGPDRDSHNYLSSVYEARFKLGHSQDTSDLDLAIKYREMALEDARKEDEELPKLLMLLATLYYNRAENSDEGGEEEEELLADIMKKAAGLAVEVINMNDCPVSERYLAVVLAAQIYYNSDMLEESVEFWQRMIDIVPRMVMRSGSYSDQEYRLKGHGGVSAQFVSTALMAEYEPEEALQLLEVGRGIIANFLMVTRVDVATLDPEHASAFQQALTNWEELRDKVKLSGEAQKKDMASWLSDSQQYHLAEAKLNGVIEAIQENPDTSDFLGPPSVDEVKKILGDDTVVIFNVSDLRCDAFLINNKMDGVKVVELDQLTMEDLARWVARLRTSRPLVDPAMLQWLWTAVTQPVLDELRFRTVAPGAKPPRIIWIPAGPLCHLPIHAAGVHASGSKETVMDRVISSFSPSLKAFLMARRLARRDTRESENLYSGQSALLIGAGEASARPGLGKLPFVAREIEDLTTICKSLNLNPVTLHDPTRAEALAQISECAIMHFAGHGLTDPLEPSQSGLLMDDGILAVSDLLDSRLQSRTPFLAFLSACLTGANDIDDLEDEGVNLTSACQLVGFNHVIGTLWQVSDRTCVEVSQGLYTTLATEGMTSESVCRGLHGAVLRLRDSWVSDGGQTRGGGSVEAVSEEWSDDDDEDEDEGEEDTGEDDEEAKSGVDSGCEPGGDEDEPSQFREAALRLKRRQKPVRNWVRADWIPYIHYGP